MIPNDQNIIDSLNRGVPSVLPPEFFPEDLTGTAAGEGFWEILKSLFLYDPDQPLLFSSGLFLFLFAGFTLFYSFMRRKVFLRMVYVLLFSTYFYYKTSGLFFILLLSVATSDFIISQSMGRISRHGVRKMLVITSVVLNLGILTYFKYTNFFISLVNDIGGRDIFAFKNIFLPVGISFYLFQSISYTVDVYRRRIQPLECWLDYAFYLTFFPQLVAGPIVRARDFIPQIRQKPLVVTRRMFATGIFLIVTGLFKKAIISDYISLNFVDRIFDDPMLYSGFENLMGLYGYALQIYCDFSGYSDMAIGIALLLGFHFNINFDSPYKSATITEFWRRWHISLSSWLKDYLYISLGGNRKGKVRTYINLSLTMLLGGFWHGAAWRFILWGAIHGVSLAVHKMTMALFPRVKPLGKDMKRVWRMIGVVFTFHLVCFSWIFFRADDMAIAGQMISQIFNGFNAALIPEVIDGYYKAFSLIILGFILHFSPARWEKALKDKFADFPVYVFGIIIVLLIWVVMQVKSADIQPFIYFQF